MAAMESHVWHVTFLTLFTLLSIVHVVQAGYNRHNKRSFVIDYQQNTFLRDGRPFRYIAGAMHYFRVPKDYWKDRMLKMKAAGLNAIQTYIAWNMHEPQLGCYDFTGNNDVVEFLKMAHGLGFVVVLRTGPYMDAERDMGGLPYWLLTVNSSMVLRTSDPSYLRYVDRWVGTLLPKIKPLLYENGGPIISVQVENEYGSYFACDFNYMHHLRDLYRKYLGNTVVLFTTDGAGDGFLKCGKVDGLYSTVDFGAGGNVSESFSYQRKHEPNGPYVNSEFYPGWIDHWGDKHAHVSSAIVVKSLSDILAMNASVTIYVFEGGTSFGFTNGANYYSTFRPNPTSYDFDAPLSEAGDPREKYYMIRETISNFTKLPPIPVPPPTMKYAYGNVRLKKAMALFDALSTLCPGGPYRSKYPKTFEELQQDYGFVLYRTNLTVTYDADALLSCLGVHDRGYVFLNKQPIGILDRESHIYNLSIAVKSGQQNILDILVENQGRICYGTFINDTKGLVSNVTLDGRTLMKWEMYTLPLNNTKNLEIVESHSTPLTVNGPEKLKHSSFWDDMFQKLKYYSVDKSTQIKDGALNVNIPAFYTGSFEVPSFLQSPQDTYLNMNNGWFHGVAFINGVNMGRYWPVRGPQVTLFIPATVLKMPPAKNVVTLLELEFCPCGEHFSAKKCSINFTTLPIINGTVGRNL